jgi:hypothetical protein
VTVEPHKTILHETRGLGLLVREAAEQAAQQVARLRHELGRYSMEAGEADQYRGLAQAALRELGLTYEDAAPVDVSDAIRSLKERNETLEIERDRLYEFCRRLERQLLDDGDPFSGDDWALLREVRVALGKQKVAHGAT